MQILVLESSFYVHAGLPVQWLITVDGHAVRVTLEWSDVERLMGTPMPDVDHVREFLHRHRTDIRLSIEAELAAQGVPLSRQLALSFDDLALLALAPPGAADAGDHRDQVPAPKR